METPIRENWQVTIDQITARRKLLKLSQSQLAALSGISQSTMSRLEQGDMGIELEHVLQVLYQLGLNIATV